MDRIKDATKPLQKRVARRAQARHDSKNVEAPLDETRVEFDDDKFDEALSDARDEAHLDTRRATQSKYE